MLQRFGARKLEAVALVMILTVAACFAFELSPMDPDWREASRGLRPQIDRSSLYIAIGILGATVMPHNLYLHSALVKTRVVVPQAQAQARALRFNFIRYAALLELCISDQCGSFNRIGGNVFRAGVS